MRTAKIFTSPLLSRAGATELQTNGGERRSPRRIHPKTAVAWTGRPDSSCGRWGAACVFGAYAVLFALPFGDGPYLFSHRLVLEWAGHAFLLLAPPLGVYLGMKHWFLTGRVFLSLATLAFGGFLSLLIVSAVVFGAF